MKLFDDKKKKTMASFRLDDDIKADVQKYNINMSAVCRQALKLAIEKAKKK